MLSTDEQHEPDELNNLLYMLHTTPVTDSIGLATIAEHTTNDPTLSALRDIVNTGQTWIPKTADDCLRKFSPLLSSITVTGNGILLKEERIILPESLHKRAIELAHRGSHPGEIGLQQRLRYHFFFHDMNKKVKEFVSACADCQAFTDKKTSEPLAPHTVPQENWSKVAVDLFGPMPSKNHIVVVQDLASRFPAAKLVRSTKASSVIPAMAEIYNNFGNPQTQLSDNGPPFNSQAMGNFCQSRSINMEKIPPLHPSANPAETFMKTVGKAMKISSQNKNSESEVLTQLLSNYRDTPHPATGITPNDMMFRDSPQSIFPRRSISEQHIVRARARDADIKHSRQQRINSGKYRQQSTFRVGDLVLIRNYEKTSKYDPLFQYSPLTITDIHNDGRCLTLQRNSDGKTFKRHPDDVKPLSRSTATPPATPPFSTGGPITTDEELDTRYLQESLYIPFEEEDYYETSDPPIDLPPVPPPPGFPPVPQHVERPRRQPIPNKRYYNEDMVNYLAC